MVEVKRNSAGGGDWSIGELARRSGVAISAIHFYERKGLIESRRTGGNQRRFERHTLRRLSIIKIAQQVGIPLAEVRAIFDEGPAQRPTARNGWQRLSRRWAADLDRRIALLEGLRNNLADCIGCGCLSLARCNLLNPSDELSAMGPGPVRLQRKHKKAGAP